MRRNGKQIYQAPEVTHLENAVKAIRDAMLPAKAKEPIPEPETQDLETDSEEHSGSDQ